MRRKLQVLLLLILAFVVAQIIEVGAQTQKIEDGCGANVAAVEKSSNVSIYVECREKEKEYLSFDYSRLFGAFEVPLLMEFIPGRPVKREFTGYRTFVTSRGKAEWIADDLYNFWRDQLPYKGASPLLTPLWQDVAGKDEVAHSIAWRSSEALRSERICFYRSIAIDGSGIDYDFLDKRFKFQSEKLCKGNDAYNRRVGFTFLIIENNSNDALADVRISFRQSYSANRVRADFHNSFSEKRVVGEVSKLPLRGEAVTNLVSKYGSAHELEFLIARSSPEFLLISKILPRQKLVAITDIFIANQNNLPATYLYGGYIFDDVQFVVGGSTKSVKIRAPSLEKAARIQVPYGWFAQ